MQGLKIKRSISSGTVYIFKPIFYAATIWVVQYLTSFYATICTWLLIILMYKIKSKIFKKEE
jgi:hypothetical protein